MGRIIVVEVLLLLLLCLSIFGFREAVGQQEGEVEVIHEWVEVDYQWASPQVRADAIAAGDFIPQNNAITGIKVYKDTVYLSVSRWRPGVWSTLNKVVKNGVGQDVLQPFPSLDMQTIGNCSALQYVQSMEIDPNTGLMWIIDVGRVNIFVPGSERNLCPAKMVIFDLERHREVDRYEFPPEVVNYTTNFLNDLVIDTASGFAYITDTSGNGGLVVFNSKEHKSHRFEHASMRGLPEFINITTANVTFRGIVPVDGVVLSPDFKSLYYSALGARALYRIPTAVLQTESGDFDKYVAYLGEKPDQSDGMVFGYKGLYFGAVQQNSVYRFSNDILQAGNVTGTQARGLISRDDVNLRWPDTFAFDNNGYLWVSTNCLPYFFADRFDYSGRSGANYRVVKIFVDDSSYLTTKPTSTASDSRSGFNFNIWGLIMFSILINFYNDGWLGAALR